MSMSSTEATTQQPIQTAGAAQSASATTSGPAKRGRKPKAAIAVQEVKQVKAPRAARVPRIAAQIPAPSVGHQATAGAADAPTASVGADGPWSGHGIITNIEQQFMRAKDIAKVLKANNAKLVSGLAAEATPEEMAGYFLDKYLTGLETSIGVLQLAE